MEFILAYSIVVTIIFVVWLLFVIKMYSKLGE